MDSDGQLEMLVGSADNMIRVFKGEEIISEFQEASRPLVLARMNKARFAFALENGMVGVYLKKARKWRAKSPLKPIALFLADFGSVKEGKTSSSIASNPSPNFSIGYRPLIVGRQNGQMEIRHDNTGETLHKLTLNAPLSKVLRDDLRMDGTKQIICVLADGSVKGYIIVAKQESGANANATYAEGDNTNISSETNRLFIESNKSWTCTTKSRSCERRKRCWSRKWVRWSFLWKTDCLHRMMGVRARLLFSQEAHSSGMFSK